uniref:N, N'-diacetylbacillosaminyl-diphospho-undecaprenol alpha-1,3-N-acetylgalactosaminyltransferase n=2 Tax=Hafnia TaxID=568 RepID=A0A172X0A1_HAFAL|nr:N,N'-diacetylbacillosaminyl-diphospho-undecaprenol alpha-1,3-N-acetylgalactosaminyltransferase [Hafnia alvei]
MHMKVLLIGNQSSTVVIFRRKIITALTEQGYSVYTLTMDNDKDNFIKIKKMGAMPSFYPFSRSGLNPLSDFLNTYKLSKKIKSIEPDVVLCFFPKPVIFGSLAAKLARVKNIYLLLEGLGFCFTTHAYKDSWRKTILRNIQVFLYKISLPRANKVLFLNHDDYHDLILEKNIKIKSSAVIGGIGVDVVGYAYSEPPSPPTHSIHFGMISRLLVEKGVREFVEAAKIIKSKYPSVRFSIAGAVDDNPGGINQIQVEQWMSEGNVEFLGQISEIKNYLEKISVFVLPSYREGVPRSTQEAMSIGRAVITTDVPGCRETIIDSYNGYMIPPWDIAALVEAMIAFIEHPERIVSMGKASRKIAVEKFDENDASAKLIGILTENFKG